MARILVIDDDPDFLTMIKLLLGMNNFNVEVAGSGEAGLKKLEDGEYDLVILDVMMPVMSGFEVCAAIRRNERFRELPVVMLTAKGEKEDIIEGITAGANDYITKPFESEVLIAKIHALIKLKVLQDELASKNKMLENLATTDGLTGVYNHRYFYSKLNEEFERANRHGFQLSCVMIDLDFFKNVNDKYGHMVGDIILNELCKNVLDIIRRYDIFARYGGEEFVLLLPQTSETGAFNEAERIRSAVEEHQFPKLSRRGEITVSMGIATFPSSAIEKAEDLVKYADAALYEAKRTGRNRIVTYHPLIEMEPAGDK